MTEQPRTSLAVVSKIPPDLRETLKSDYTLLDAALPLAADDPARRCRIIVTTSMAGATAATMDAFPDLGLIVCNGASLDRFDMAHAAARGITIEYTPDELLEDTADFGVALLYAVSRKVVEADKFVRAGRWLTERMAASQRVTGKTAGIVGLGRIGRIVAKRLTGIGMTVKYHGRKPQDVPYEFVPDLAALATDADVLVLTCTGNESTRNLVGTEILDRLGPRGILINISRGSVVDEAALIAALVQKKIYGAGLDVFATEPQLDPRFLTLDNVVLAPHYASLTSETRAAMIKRMRDGIVKFLAKAP